ncbi:hypothetical protein AB0I75_32335 [Streptomyces sp. NPDC050273]|uniref:hypothetical protein n=1 Tax=Streptomyces sp. NPDC050273 TaxID=3154933 RepID=UPI003431B821
MDVLIPIPSPEDGERALGIFERLMDKAGDGFHHLVIVVQGIGGPALGHFRYVQKEGLILHVNEDWAMEFCHLLAAAISGSLSGGFVMRTRTEAEAESVCGWRITNGDTKPLSRAEVFDAYCHNPTTGETFGPEPGVEYKDAPAIH